MNAKKIIIIGAGVSGLTAGIYGKMSGFEVEIYEKHTIAGGECTGWDRHGYHIDNCIHWLMGTTPGTELNKIWRTTDAVNDVVGVYRADKMYTSELHGETLTLWSDLEKTRHEMLALSPEDENEINDLMAQVELAKSVSIPASKPAELMGPLNLIKMMKDNTSMMKLFKKYRKMDTTDLRNRFKHPLIREVLSDFCPKESLAYSFPVAYGNFVAGDGGIPRGGSRAMAVRMGKKFETLGGKLFLGKPVHKIEVGNGKATSLVLADGTKVQGDYIIPANDPSYLFNVLLNPSYMDEVFREIYNKPDAYPIYGMFQVAIAVDHPEDLLGGDLNLDVSDLRTESWMGPRMAVKTYSYEPSFAPAGKQIMQILYGGSASTYDFFAELYKDKAAYKAKKQKIAEKLMSRIADVYPGYWGKMSVLDVWTPVTYQRYCNAYKGYNQACMITKQSRKNPYPSAYLKGLDNVVLAGQWLSPPGGLPGAAIQGKYAIQRILKKEKRPINI